MPIYNYQAVDESGGKSKGTVTASTEKEARSKLRSQGVMLLSLSLRKEEATRQTLSNDNLVSFTQQLAQIIKAGIPLYEGLLALEEQYAEEKFHPTITSLCEAIKGGSSLSEAMASHPSSFNSLYCSMIEAGESAGALETTLERLAELLSKSQKMKKQLITSMIYPSLLAVFSLIIIFSLVTFVVPSIENIFADRSLSGITAFVLGTSHFLRSYWYIYLPTIIATIIFLTWKIKTPSGKKMVDKLLLHTPVLKTLITQTALARFSRTLATLQEGGVPLIASIQIARHVMGNQILEAVIKEAEEKIIQGSTLSKEMKKSPLIPRLVTRLLSTGEESGNISGMLTNIANIYEGEVEKTLSRLTALAQPIILIVMGFVVGIVLLGVLLPLTDISSLSMGRP